MTKKEKRKIALLEAEQASLLCQLVDTELERYNAEKTRQRELKKGIKKRPHSKHPMASTILLSNYRERWYRKHIDTLNRIRSGVVEHLTKTRAR